MTTLRQAENAAFWDDTICPACGALGQPPLLPCEECDVEGAVVLPGKTMLLLAQMVAIDEAGEEA